ncbi:MAG TPA: hypothetical protein VKQ72_04890 [Aggregatilineales bacterium]|nr:hypothetical protein [Aggregatilineales bacterium]
MSIDYPINTLILITIGALGIGVAVWFLLSEALNRLPLSAPVKRNWRWGAAVVLVGWAVVRLLMEINPPGGQPIGTLVTVAFVAFGLIVGTLPLVFSSNYRQIVRATPSTWLIGLQMIRVIGGFFLVLLDMKLLPANFALPAGYGDVTVGVLSVVVVYLLATNKPYARSAAVLWNLLGLLDLIIALATGTTFIPAFTAQLAATGVSLSYLNYVLVIPAYGVPLAAVAHIYSLYQLSSRHGAETKQAADAPVQSSAFAK